MPGNMLNTANTKGPRSNCTNSKAENEYHHMLNLRPNVGKKQYSIMPSNEWLLSSPSSTMSAVLE